MGFGKSDKQLATAFNVSVADIKKIKAQIAKDMTKPTPKPTPKKKPKPKHDITKIPGFKFGRGTE